MIHFNLRSHFYIYIRRFIFLKPLTLTIPLAALAAVFSQPAHAALFSYSSAGANAAAIQATVDQFRADLGGVNNGVNAFGGVSGRREINWDGVPNGFAASNTLPANFFNQNSQRGMQLGNSPGGTGFMVSDNAAGGNGAGVRFDNLNATYSGIFQTFSAQKLFISLGSNEYDINFFVPLTGPALPGSTPALVIGFGIVFADVDLANTTRVQAFDINGVQIANLTAAAANNGLSFVGLRFDTLSIARIHVTQGNAAVGPNDGGAVDVVAVDDFIYGEPVSASSVPEPGSMALAAIGAFALYLRRHR